jgi:hypothetical protein
MPIRALAVSDQVDPRVHSTSIRQRMGDVQIVFGCGDLPASYLEFLADALDRPVYFVYGNHLEEATRQPGGELYQPMGCVDLGGKVVRDTWSGLILAGIPGSPKYAENEPMQFSEFQIRWMMLKMVPKLLWNRLRHGRALDILITHSPARDLGDREDLPHRGFVSFRSLLQRWQPKYMLHGHVHLYDRSQPFMHTFERTTIVNVYPFRVLDLDLATSLDHKFPHDAEIRYPPMGDGLRARPAPAAEKEPAHG